MSEEILKIDTLMTEQPVHETLEQNYMPYAMAVIISRALPSVYDSFKPSHRKLLYMAEKIGLLYKKTKSANLVGQTMKLNPHGDQAIYETMVRMVDGNESLLTPYFKGKGNFGKVYSRDMAYAAARYTEGGLSDIAKELFRGIDENTIDFEDNYDSTMKEPKVLPVSFPNILTNCTEGIAVGMASKICSFNLKEVCEATIHYLENESMHGVVLIPDFSTGGQYIHNQKELQGILESGRGSVKVRSKYRFSKETNTIEVYEIPYSTTVEAIIDKIEELYKAGKVKEITDIRDETDLSGVKLAIDIKRGVNVETLMSKLFKMTPLEDKYHCNFNVLVNDENGELYPKVMGVHKIIPTWCEWRTSSLRRGYDFRLDKLNKELHLLVGLEKILLDIDKAIEIVKGSASDEEVVSNLAREFEIDEIQAEHVANIRLRNFNKQFILEKTNNKEKLETQIAEIEQILSDDKNIHKVMIQQLKEIIKKHGIDRKTEIIYEDNVIEFKKEDLIEDTSCFLIVSQEGYAKKMQKKVDINTIKLKDGDSIIYSTPSTNKSTLLVFTNLGNCYKMFLHDLEFSIPSKLGQYLPNLLGFENEEQVIASLCTKDYEGHILNCFENGKLVKVPLSSFETKQNRAMLKNAISISSKLINQIFMPDNDLDIICQSSNNRILITNTFEFPPKAAKDAGGNILMELKKNVVMTRCIPLSEIDTDKIADIDYYVNDRATRGSVLRKSDRIVIKD